MMKTERAEFFLVALPGLEDLVLAETKEWFPKFEAKGEHGGVTVFAPLGEGLAMNLVLKTPTRILLRLDRFRCRDFPSLYNRIASFPWRDWVNPACELEVNVSTRLSRLKIKKRIEETCEDGWITYRKKIGVLAERGRKVGLFIRFLNDECTLSLDTSGERLHKRGLRRYVGEAPLRETIAAALLQWVRREDGADHPDGVEIMDPMVGSGTFLLEAAVADRCLEQRDFAFENFAAQPPHERPALALPIPKLTKLVGFERDDKTLEAARANLAEAKPSCSVELHDEDLFKAKPLPESKASRWLFANPPYGERLKVKEPLADYYARLFAACETLARPDKACFLLPSKAVKGRFVLPVGWKVLAKRPFVNGGIPVVAFLFGCEKRLAVK